MNITFDFLEKNKYESVTDYCRVLIEQETFPETIYVYRGEMLCLTVDVKKAAKLVPMVTHWGKYREDKYLKGQRKRANDRTEV